MTRKVSVSTRRVDHEMQALLRGASQWVRHETMRAFRRIEEDPAAYVPLDWVPDDVASVLESRHAWLRKVSITHQKHDHRLIYLHMEHEDGNASADFLFVLHRRDGYNIDWDLVRSALGE